MSAHCWVAWSFSSTNPFFSGPRTPSPSPQGCSHSTQNNLCPAFTHPWGCPILVQDLALDFTEIQEAGTGLPLRWTKMPADVISFLQCVECTTQLVGVSQLAEGDLHPTDHIADKSIPKPTPWEFHLSLFSPL